MLKVDIGTESRKYVSVTASGQVDEIILDSAIMISGLFAQLRETDPALANLFRYKLTALLTDQDTPVWSFPAAESGVVLIIPDNKKRRLNNV